MTGHQMPVADRWALDTGAAIAVSHGSVSLVANATLTPELARDLARRLLAAADDAEIGARAASRPGARAD
jgi:hypothetical protein